MNFGQTGSTPTLNFGTPSTGAPAFGAAPAPQQLSFGTLPTSNAGSQPQLTFGGGGLTGAAAAAPQLSFGGAAAAAAPATSNTLTLGGTNNTALGAPKPISFGAPTLGSTASAAAPLLSNTLTASNPLQQLGGGDQQAAAAAPSLTSLTSGASTGLAAASAATAAAVKPTAQASLSTTTTTTASANAPAAQLNFCQLEEHINKWTLALDEQEKMFMNQATQVNSWDKVLISNNNKIVALSEAVEKVKIDQQALEQELEFIAAQHAELDEGITPLEQELSKTLHMDADKAHTYVLAENLDTQLRQMSDDLKEVIEHLNEANKVQDTSDPIVQIGLILNAHMSSLQWIESSTAQVLTKIDDISNIYDTLRRDNERSIRLTYD